MLPSERLKKLYEEKAAKGLLDVKFDIDLSDAPTFEDLCAEVLAMEDAIAAGKSTPLSFGDARWRDVPRDSSECPCYQCVSSRNSHTLKAN